MEFLLPEDPRALHENEQLRESSKFGVATLRDAPEQGEDPEWVEGACGLFRIALYDWLWLNAAGCHANRRRRQRRCAAVCSRVVGMPYKGFG